MSQAPRPTGPGQPARPEADPSALDRAARVADLGLIVGFLALTFLLGVFPLKDTDFWWHLKAGDLIRQTGAGPDGRHLHLWRRGAPLGRPPLGVPGRPELGISARRGRRPEPGQVRDHHAWPSCS